MRKESEEEDIKRSSLFREHKFRSHNDVDPLMEIEKEDSNEARNLDELMILKPKFILKNLKYTEKFTPLELKELTDFENSFFGQEQQLGHPRCLTVNKENS